MASVLATPPKPDIVDFEAPVDYAALKGKTAIITGGASGFGKAMAMLWASKGAFVIIADINEKQGQAAVAEIRAASGSRLHHFVHVDVTSWDSQVTLFQRATKLSPGGHVDIVVANAGVNEFGIETNFQGVANGGAPVKPNLKTMDINSTGVIYTAHLAYWAFSMTVKKATDGKMRAHHLLLLGSMASFTPTPGTPMYNASKHAVLGLFRALRAPSMFPHRRKLEAQAIKERGYVVHVNLLCPYFVDTPLLRALDTKDKKSSVADSGMELAKIEDVVESATRLVTDQSENGGGKAIVVATPAIAKGRGKRGKFQLLGIQAKL